MNYTIQDKIRIVHNSVPNRIRLQVPIIQYKDTFAELLKQCLLSDANAKGIYHAEPNVITGTLLVKYHPAFHTEAEVIELVRSNALKLKEGKVDITQKHKNPKVFRMRPGAFFTREFLVSIAGNVVAGLILAFVIAG